MRRKKPIQAQVGEALTDSQLVCRVLAGETPLFEILVHRHSQRVYRAARAIVRDDEEAADIVQETYLRAYRSLGQFAERAKFLTWLTKIAVYEARARARKSRARGINLEDTATDKPTPELDPEKRVMVAEMRTMLEAAIDGLPDLYRAVFVLRQVEGMGTAETAECLNLSEDAVKTRLRRARALLRKKLYSSMGRMGPEAFTFGGQRCRRMWTERILPALRSVPSARPSQPCH